jgi:hypothetical protein
MRAALPLCLPAPLLSLRQGGIDAHGGTDVPSVAESTDTAKLEGSDAAEAKAGEDKA